MRIGELLKASAVPLNEKGGVLHRRQDQYPIGIFDRVLSGRYQVGEQFENRHLALTLTPSKETAQNAISHQARAQRRPSLSKICLEVEDSLNPKRLAAYERTIVL